MKLLVLCVDRDDDLGQKTKIHGPVMGRDKVLKAAAALALADPSEADANTMFEAVRTLDKEKDCKEVAVLTGHSSRGLRSDKEITRQLDNVLSKTKPDSVLLVTDGDDDDQVIPIIQSRVKIISKKMLIIKQAKELERSYYVLKEALRDPAFARIIFGLPGIILLVVSFFQDLGVRLIVLAVGAYLVIKGFGVEDMLINAVSGFRETTGVERASFPLYIGALLTLLLAFWAGAEKLMAEPNQLKQASAFMDGFLSLIIISVVLFIAGRLGDMHYRNEPLKVRKHAFTIVTASSVWLVLLKANALMAGKITVDEFIIWLLAAFAITIVGLSIVRKLYVRKYVLAKLQKGTEAFDQHGNKIGTITDFSSKNVTIQLADGQKTKIPPSKILQVKEYAAIRV